MKLTWGKVCSSPKNDLRPTKCRSSLSRAEMAQKVSNMTSPAFYAWGSSPSVVMLLSFRYLWFCSKASSGKFSGTWQNKLNFFSAELLHFARFVNVKFFVYNLVLIQISACEISMLVRITKHSRVAV